MLNRQSSCLLYLLYRQSTSPRQRVTERSQMDATVNSAPRITRQRGKADVPARQRSGAVYNGEHVCS